MKNHGRPKNAKGQRRAIEALNSNPRIVERSVRPGFVVGRLVNDLRDLIGEAQLGYDLGMAVGRLCAKPGYESLERDLKAEMGQEALSSSAARPARRWWKPWAKVVSPTA